MPVRDDADDDAPTASPDLRRPAPSHRQVITARVDIHDAEPSIWRRLELRSDLSLADLHDVLQVAFDWQSYHLWRFAAGGDPFSDDAQQFLCEDDVEEGEYEGIPAGEVRLGELLQAPGDSLEYLYDYGDAWNLGIVVEAVRDAEPGAAPVHVNGGERAAPPEDSGGVRTAEALAAVFEDPGFVDIAELDRELHAGP